MKTGLTLRKNTKYIIAILFFLLIPAAFLPMVTLKAGPTMTGISFWDLSQLIGRARSAEDIAFIGDLIEPLKNLLRFFMILWILSIVFPLIEGILAVLLRPAGAMLSAGLGILVNVTIKAILVVRLQSINDAAGDLLNIPRNVLQILLDHEVDDPIRLQLNTASMVIWTLIHLMIAALIVWYVLQERAKDTKKKLYKTNKPWVIDEPFEKGREIMVEKAFYGTIAGLTGEYSGKGYPMLLGETVSVGSTQGDDIHIAAAEEESVCQISYDEAMQEYHVLPTVSKAVFMRSGQPLGAHRLYCLPRGTEIMILDRRNRFLLA